MKRWHGMLVAGILLAAPAVLRAEGTEGGGKDEFSSEMVDKRKAELDANLAKRLDMIEKEFAEQQAFETSMKDARVGFEKKSVEERKGFLDTLKGLKGEDRKKAFRDFNDKQVEGAKEFQESQRRKREDRREAKMKAMQSFREGMKSERRDQRDEMKKERQDHRQEKQDQKDKK